MKFPTASITLVALCVFVGSSGAEAPKKENDDVVLTALAKTENDMYERQGEIAKRALPLIARLEELVSKGKDPKKPLNEQLSQKDLDEWNLISAQMRFTEGSRIFNDRRLEDIAMIKSLHRASVFMTKTAIEYINDSSGRDFDSYLLASARKAGMEAEVLFLVAVRTLSDKGKKEPKLPEPMSGLAPGHGSS